MKNPIRAALFFIAVGVIYKRPKTVLVIVLSLAFAAGYLSTLI